MWMTREDGERAHVESRIASDTICIEIPENGFKGAGGGKVGKEAWVLPVHQSFVLFYSRREGLSIRFRMIRNQVTVCAHRGQ